MVKSMTGYGRAVQTVEGREVTVEIRSVNNRYLDCTVKLPRLFSFAEEAVKQKVKEYVTRGKVDVFISVGASQTGDVSISLNHPVLEGYLAAMQEIAETYGVKNDISVNSLSRLPDVFTVEKAEEDEDALKAGILVVIEQALTAYNAMRMTEGQALERDLKSKAQNILLLVARVEERSPETVAEYRLRLEAKMREVLESATIDEARILTEAAIFADKVAVDEETVRLRSHLKQLDTMLSSDEPIGRKLDFLMQEMNREANTIGSKCNDLTLAGIVVEIKAELEKIREQMQNIE